MSVDTEPQPAQLREHSYAVVRGLFDAATTQRLREICERVLEQWRRAPRSDNPPVSPQANYMRHLNDPEYHRDYPEDLAFLLNAMGAPEVVESLSAALEEEYLFAMASLYFNPSGESQDGFWHKDKIGQEAEVSRIPETGAGLQMQIALVPTDDLELVPGSHLRDYSPEEHAICVADGAIHNRLNDMPGAVRLSLEPGDAALFTQLCIHRGRYHTDKLRRTMMISVKKRAAAEFSIRQRGLDYSCDQPWFLAPQYLAGVNEQARSFLREFADFYAPHWRSRLTQWLKYSSLVQRLEEEGESYPFSDE
jgi:ectoine hydroxylase-related dioxygenase (phytanoyl-CoA dioxygenase family)